MVPVEAPPPAIVQSTRPQAPLASSTPVASSSRINHGPSEDVTEIEQSTLKGSLATSVLLQSLPSPPRVSVSTHFPDLNISYSPKPSQNLISDMQTLETALRQTLRTLSGRILAQQSSPRMDVATIAATADAIHKTTLALSEVTKLIKAEV